MVKFNSENFALNLPDTFRKDKNSNNYKLLRVDRHIYNRILSAIQSVYDVLDIDNATGKTLDMFGQRLHLQRGISDDAQYRLRLKGKIGQSLCDGSRQSVATALAFVLQCSTSQIQIKTDANTGEVELLGLPLEILTNAGFTGDEITVLINDMLPENVVLKAVNYTGTFTFAETDGEASDIEGFADDDGTIGGYFGLGDM